MSIFKQLHCIKLNVCVMSNGHFLPSFDQCGDRFDRSDIAASEAGG